MTHPDTTKYKSPLSYPLSTPVEGVDETVETFGQLSRVSPERGPGASEPHPNQGCAIPCVYKCVGCCGCPSSHSGMWAGSPASLSLYRFRGLWGENPHFGRNGENLCKSWGRSRFWVFL